MLIQRTQTLRANLCICYLHLKYVIAGNTDLYEQNAETNELIVVADHDQRKFTIFDSILVFCECGRLTIHSPTINNGIWHSRKMRTGWRGRRINLVWNEMLPTKKRTLLNISKIELLARGGIDRIISFVNDPNDGFRIHSKQRKLADEIFTDLLFSIFKFQLFQNINFRIRDIAGISAEIAQSQLGSLSICSKVLPAAIEELSRLKGTIKSPRLKNLRKALNKARIGAGFPMLPFDDGGKGQPEIIKQLLEIRA